MRKIKINFLPYVNQTLDITIYRKLCEENKEDKNIYIANLPAADQSNKKYEITFSPQEGFEAFKINSLGRLFALAMVTSC